MATKQSTRNEAIAGALFSGERHIDVAHRFGITRQRVEQLARRYSVPLVKPRITDNEATIFRDLVKDGYTQAEASQAVGRHCQSLVRACKKLGFLADVVADRRSWTDDEIALLHNSYGRLRVRIIADRIGRTRNEVIGKAHRLGLSSACV